MARYQLVLYRAGLLGLMGAGALAPALAQPAANDDRIVVAATRQAEEADDLPQSVSVLANDDLGPADGAEDVVNRLVGVQAAISNGSQTTFQIRGVGAVDHQALTPSGAAVHLDGVFLATNVQASLLAYDLARVEVLKGPQGAVQGRNASSGSLNFFSVRPGAEPEGYVELSYGRFSRWDLKWALGGPVGEGVRGRFAGRYLKQDPALANVGGPADAGGVREELGLRGALEFDLAVSATLMLRAHYESDTGVNPAPRNSALTLNDHRISVGSDGIRDTDNDFFGASAEVSASVGDWTLVSLTAVEGFRQRYGFDFDGQPAAIANLSYDRAHLQLSEDIHARTRWQGGDALVGLSLATDEFTQDYLIWCGVLNPATLVGSCQYPAAPARVGPTPASAAPAVSLLTQIEQTRNTAAIYGTVDVALAPATTLTLGGRLTQERIEGAGFGQHIYADGVRALNNRSGLGRAQGGNTIDDGRFTAMAALSHRLSPDAMAYLSFGQGYKSGGFNGEVANNVTHYQDEGLFRAETVDAWEIGYKASLGEAATFTAAAFYQDYSDPQARIFVFFPLPGGGSITSNSLSNLDAARVTGAEISARWRPYDGFEIGAALTALDTEIEQGADAGGTANAATFDGKPLPFASELSATLQAQHAWTLPGGARLSLEAFAKHQGEYFLDAEGRADRRQGPVTLVDAAARLSLADGTELSLWGRNLTDEDYALSGYGFIGYNTFRSQPASWGVSVRVNR